MMTAALIALLLAAGREGPADLDRACTASVPPHCTPAVTRPAVILRGPADWSAAFSARGAV